MIQVPVVQAAPSLKPTTSDVSWSSRPLSLDWDVAHARPAREKTIVHISTDGSTIYVRFDAQQNHTVVATQHGDDLITGGNPTGGIAWSNDDAVWVDLWPTGPGGFRYQFESNPAGAHNEASTENAAFAPRWRSQGAATSGGYTVTMAIPMAVIHGAHSGSWRVQFVRCVRDTGDVYVWSYDVAQQWADDDARAGTIIMDTAKKSAVPKPRAAIYGLGVVAKDPAVTSRSGADFSVPITSTAALFATIHPDFSNVELDQQSIAPTVYQRTYNEVRPFFTQAASYYNNFNQYDQLNTIQTLYTPAIPTPREGYAIEGRQGNVGVAAFDSIGIQRNDFASAAVYHSPDSRLRIATQQVVTQMPSLFDITNQFGFSWNNGRYLKGYANFATDRGTNVTNPSAANWLDAGFGYQDQHAAYYGAVRTVGAQFNPVDGFDSHPDISGYALTTIRGWTFSKNDVLLSAGADVFVDRYQGSRYGQAQSDNALQTDLLFKNGFDVVMLTGSSYWRFGDILTPISQVGGFDVIYNGGTQYSINNFPSHGPSAYPTQVQYYTGHYGDGRLDTWVRSSVIKAGERGTLTLTLDNTSQWFDKLPSNIQWFEGASFDYQISRDSSFALGVRRVTGMPPQPNGGGNCEGACANVSFAYHFRAKTYELYTSYGDPNALSTQPSGLMKLIFYLGSGKGT